MKYLTKQPTTKKTPQSEPIPGREREMTRNSAGGVTFKADSFTRMERFLILGSEGGTYYVSERDLTKQNIDNLRACIATDGLRAVKMIRSISVSGRAPKNDPALYALALAASYGGDEKVRAAALDALPAVARIGTHLFTFAEFINEMRGWGPALRKAVANWYTSKTPREVAYQLVKYQQRNGWSHRDLFKLSHPERHDWDNSAVVQWVLKQDPESEQIVARWPNRKKSEARASSYAPSRQTLPHLIQAFELTKAMKTDAEVCSMIREYGLTREMIPTEFQKSPEVWEALLEKMPPHAMIRTLGRMSASKLLTPLSTAEKLVVERLSDGELLRKKRVHPLDLLTALLAYQRGKGLKGDLTWEASTRVVEALDAAFYLAFSFVKPTNKRFYLALDVSGSMTGGSVAGSPLLSPNMGAAAMAMLIARTEPQHFIGGFATQFCDLGITSRDSLSDACRKAMRDFGGTDCAVAIQHALIHKYPVDAFVIITDGMTWAGDIHASQAIEQYRCVTKIDSKLIVINMVAEKTSLTDPTDPGSLDIVGFDTTVPAMINGFIGAEIESQEDDE